MDSFVKFIDPASLTTIIPNPDNASKAFTAPFDCVVVGGVGLSDRVCNININGKSIISGRGMGSYNNGHWFYLPLKEGDVIYWENSNFWFGNSLSYADFRK